MLELEMPVRVSEDHPSSGLWSLLLYTYWVDSSATYMETHSKVYSLQPFCSKESKDNARSASVLAQSPAKLSTLSLDSPSCQSVNGETKGLELVLSTVKIIVTTDWVPNFLGLKAFLGLRVRQAWVQRQEWLWKCFSLFCYALFLLVNLNTFTCLSLFNTIIIHRPMLPTGKIHQYPRPVGFAK